MLGPAGLAVLAFAFRDMAEIERRNEDGRRHWREPPAGDTQDRYRYVTIVPVD